MYICAGDSLPLLTWEEANDAKLAKLTHLTAGGRGQAASKCIPANL